MSWVYTLTAQGTTANGGNYAFLGDALGEPVTGHLNGTAVVSAHRFVLRDSTRIVVRRPVIPSKSTRHTS